MNRNTSKNEYGIEDISNAVNNLKTKDELVIFFKELLTQSEIETLSKRWRILNLLNEGFTQREIAQELGVSLCKVTRGSKILKNSNSILAKCLTKEN